MRYAPQSTPTKRALSEDGRDDGEYENRRSMSEDDRDDGEEQEYTRNVASGLSGVALLNVSNYDNQNEQGLQTRPQPVQLRLGKGSKSSRKRKLMTPFIPRPEYPGFLLEINILRYLEGQFPYNVSR